MGIFENFSALFLEVWKKGILGVDIFQILIGLAIFFNRFIMNLLIKPLNNKNNKNIPSPINI